MEMEDLNRKSRHVDRYFIMKYGSNKGLKATTMSKMTHDGGKGRRQASMKKIPH